jgi:protein O-GlcNAc transferase
MNITTSIQSALDHYQKGDLQQAASLCRAILKERPNDAELLHFLGIVYTQMQQYDSAIEYFKKALQFNTTNAEGYLALAIVIEHQGRPDEALQYYEKAVSLNPHNDEVYIRLGDFLKEKGMIDKAINTYKHAVQINPNDANLLNKLGNSLQRAGRTDEAIPFYQKALHLNPDLVEGYNNLGAAFVEKGLFEEAATYYQKAIERGPYFTVPYTNLGHVLRKQGKKDAAIAAFEKAIELDPHNCEARLAKCISQLPVIYMDETELSLCRSRYEAELLNLQSAVSLETPQAIESAANAVATQQPFFLAYQGLNDRELQRTYGNFMCKIMSLRYPEFSVSPAMPIHKPDEPLRIGFVSGFFNLHSNWKIPIKGWIENIDKQRFALYGYYTGTKKDIATVEARNSFARFVEDVHSFDQLCRIIREDNLHMLIYPEIGMWKGTARLAMLRLAPVQCSSWGHPDTSGLPSIDYFLSSDLMEPPDADEHYTEKLVRLPNLSIFYTPLDTPSAALDRAAFGLRQTSVLYLCCQSLYKYLPQYDEVYPRIARQVGDCQFIFISNESVHVTGQFRRRIRQAFHKLSLEADDYAIVLPRLDGAGFNAINSLSDICLDSIGWSGCNSTFEALVHHLPVVTLPGRYMRGRHSSAILTMMGVTETITSSLDEYIELAVRLGLDSEKRKGIRSKIAANLHRIYQDKTCVSALEDFIEQVVEQRTQG